MFNTKPWWTQEVRRRGLVTGTVYGPKFMNFFEMHETISRIILKSAPSFYEKNRRVAFCFDECFFCHHVVLVLDMHP